MKSFRDVERRMADLERQVQPPQETTWEIEAARREAMHAAHDYDVDVILETMVEAGVLPHPDLFDDESDWMAAVVAELNRMHRAQYMPYAGGCGDPACDVCAVRSDG